MTHPGFTRNYESTLALLAERGHRVHLAFDGPPQVGKPSAVDGLCERFHAISYGPAPERDDVWSPLAGATRATRNYLRYLHPRYRKATRLRERALVWPLSPLLEALARSPFGGRRGLALLDGLLRRVERVVPSSRQVERFIRQHRPDVVLVTPVVDFNTPQLDQVKAARALGVPTGVCVASWDNLTNKGLIQVAPDLVTVWNEAQKREAVALHGIPSEKVVVTGAQLFDEWFAREPGTTREQFCSSLGLPVGRPLILYTCSSQWIAPHEVPFVERWLRVLRGATPPLGNAGVLIRPHPQNAAQWQGVDFTAYGDVAIWPRDPSARVDSRSKAEFFDSLHHSAAVVGINTSALIEAGILGRPVFTVLEPEYRASQEGTLHFQYLVEASGGLLQVAHDLGEHVGQLRAALVEGGHDERARAFVSSFVRPYGIDRPATPILADAIQRLQSVSTRPDRAPAWTLAVRPVLFGLALLVRAAWTGLRSRQPSGRAPSPATRETGAQSASPTTPEQGMVLTSTLSQREWKPAGPPSPSQRGRGEARREGPHGREDGGQGEGPPSKQGAVT
jgi:hypothetical protein